MEDMVPDSPEFLQFIKDEKDKNINILVYVLDVPQEDAEDIYTEACLSLRENLQKGRVFKEAGLSAYLRQICKFKANHFHRHYDKNSEVDFDQIEYQIENDTFTYRDDKINKILETLDETGKEKFISNLLDKVKGVVLNLPIPCNKLLWMRYWDRLSHQEIAAVMKYKSQSVSKTLTSRCLNKFKNKIYELMEK